jgi:two-component system, OmpR family, response regulator
VDQSQVYALTRKGKAELNSAATSLSAIDLELLVLVDSKASLGRILEAFASQPQPAMLDALLRLNRAGLIVDGGDPEAGGDGSIEASGFFTRPVFPESADSKSTAAAESGETLALLRRDGYVARIAKRAAKGRKLTKGEQIHVVVIEDDAQLANLLRMFLSMHDFVPRIAANREGIVAALRGAPIPDVVLLDVSLPDVDGFDVLTRIKQHPALKSVPVVMMTAKATREAVLKGLARGADGYITKPFNVDIISKAIGSVLGLK